MNEDLVCRVVGQMDNTADHTFESANRVYDKDGLCPTIPTGTGGGHLPKILSRRFYRQAVETLENNDCEEGDAIDAFHRSVVKNGICPSITTRPEGFKTAILPVVKGEIVQGGLQEHQKPRTDGISPSVTAACGMGGGQTPIFTERRGTMYRIRKLTPRECGRLMGVDDSDIDKMEAVNSNSQLYRQFGDSIVVDVMCAMFRNLNIKGVRKGG